MLNVKIDLHVMNGFLCVMCVYLVQGENGLAAHVLEQQLGDLQMLLTTGVVQRRVASLPTVQKNIKNNKLQGGA